MLVENKARSVSRIPRMRASRSRDLLILLAVAAALALPSGSYADELPAPSFTLEATGATSLTTGGSITGTTTTTVILGGTQISTATAAYGLGDASVSANGSTVGGENTALSSAEATVIYYVQAVQTGNTPVAISQVPLIFTGSVSTSASGTADASASFETPGGALNACSTSNGPCGSPGSNSGSINYNASPGAIYDVEVNAIGASGDGSGTWFAAADPQVEIDPSFAYASDFTVEFSPGGTSGGGGTNPPPSVPEPSTLALLSVALSALLGLTAMCKRLGS